MTDPSTLISEPLGRWLIDKTSLDDLMQSLRERTEWSGHLQVRHADGSVMSVHASTQRTSDPDAPEIELAVSRVRHERARPRAKPKAGRDAFRTLFLNVHEPIYLLNALGLIRDANPAAEQLHCCLPQDLVGRSVADLRDLVGVDAAIDQLPRALAGERLRLEAQRVRPDGGHCPLDLAAEAVDIGGETLVLCIAREADNPRSVQQQLYQLAQRSSLALSSAKQGLYDLNLKTGACEVSDEYATMLGYDPASFVETNARWIERLHPDDHEPVAAYYRDYVAGKHPEYRVEFRQRTREGQWKWILSIGKIIERDREGNPLRMIGTHTDISEMKLTQEELGRRWHELSRLSRASLADGLAAAVAHEVNQPLCAITNYLSAVRRTVRSGGFDAETILIDVSSALAASERAALIIRQFKNLFAKQKLDVKPCNWQKLLRQSLMMIEGDLHQLQIRVVQDYEPDLPRVMADPTLLQQVMLNLMQNAIEAMAQVEPGRRVLTLQLRRGALAEATSVELLVSDTGGGFVPCVVDGQFEPCPSTKPDGLGLGLSISQKIMHTLNGELKLLSSGVNGSILVVCLPALDKDTHDSQSGSLRCREAH